MTINDSDLNTVFQINKFKPWVDRVLFVIANGQQIQVYDDTLIQEFYHGDIDKNKDDYLNWLSQLSKTLNVVIDEFDYIWMIAENIKLKEEGFCE